MLGKMIHECIHVLDLEKSIGFYEKAFGLTVVDSIVPDDRSWMIVYLGNDRSDFQLELTWNEDRTEPYNNGGQDTHLAFEVEDFDAAYALHSEMGCIVRENKSMGIYFITDPDGCWLEVLPQR